VGVALAWSLILLPLPLFFLLQRARRSESACELARRADEQHAALVRGDRIQGIHGLYPPSI